MMQKNSNYSMLMPEENSVDAYTHGHAFYSQLNFPVKVPLASSGLDINSALIKKSKADCRLAFSKCPNIKQNHCIINNIENQEEKGYQILALEPILVNDIHYTSKDGYIELYGMDRVQFPCDTCIIPHLYYMVITPSDP